MQQDQNTTVVDVLSGKAAVKSEVLFDAAPRMIWVIGLSIFAGALAIYIARAMFGD